MTPDEILTAIDAVRELLGASAARIADHLGASEADVEHMLKQMQTEGKVVNLTDAGRTVADKDIAGSGVWWDRYDRWAAAD